MIALNLITPTKRCIYCARWLALTSTNFRRRRVSPDGWAHLCKPCAKVPASARRRPMTCSWIRCGKTFFAVPVKGGVSTACSPVCHRKTVRRRQRLWARANPDLVRANQGRFRRRHLEERRADARARTKLARLDDARRLEHNADQRARRAADPERYRQYVRNWRARQRLICACGTPKFPRPDLFPPMAFRIPEACPACTALDGTGAETRMLIVLRSLGGPVSLDALELELGVGYRSVHAILKRLVKRGVVVRRVEPTNSREGERPVFLLRGVA